CKKKPSRSPLAPLPTSLRPCRRPLSPSSMSASPAATSACLHRPSPPPPLLLSAATARSRRIRIRCGRGSEEGRMPAGHGVAATAHGAERRPPCAQVGPHWTAGRVPIALYTEEGRLDEVDSEEVAWARESLPVELLDVLRKAKHNTVRLRALQRTLSSSGGCSRSSTTSGRCA